VLVDVAHPRLSRVTIDDVAGGRLATEHLLARGHTRIGFVGDDASGPLRFTSSEFRLDGYREALASHGLGVDDGLIRHGVHGRRTARDLAAELLASAEPPSAIFAASDIQAVGVLEAAAAAGLGVPGDLAVIGFDDIEFAEIVGLTTIRQPLAEIGASAIELLTSRIGGDERDPVEIVHPLTLVQRRTT
jgi:LacI family transcriptional regulator/LacI family repressor for deo operon, udp, cdd, tsx, nupC, and nupG